MAVAARVLPDGSVTVTDGVITYPPLSPEAVQAVAKLADASAAAGTVAGLTESLMNFASLLPQIGPAGRTTLVLDAAGAHATVDSETFGMVQEHLDGESDGEGRWVDGNLTYTQAQRFVTDGTTEAGTTVTSATANFRPWDVGRPITGGTIPADATIAKVIGPHTATISAPATTVATGVTLTIG